LSIICVIIFSYSIFNWMSVVLIKPKDTIQITSCRTADYVQIKLKENRLTRFCREMINIQSHHNFGTTPTHNEMGLTCVGPTSLWVGCAKVVQRGCTPIISRFYSTLLQKKMRTDSRTTLLQQVYNSPLTWDGPHSVWSPPHVRGLLYTCCKSDVFLSFFKKNYNLSLAGRHVYGGYTRGKQLNTCK
jgi:hypothetical protein